MKEPGDHCAPRAFIWGNEHVLKRSRSARSCAFSSLLLRGSGVGSVEMFDLLGLWLSQENVLKGRGVVAAQVVARRVIMITDHRV